MRWKIDVGQSSKPGISLICEARARRWSSIGLLRKPCMISQGEREYGRAGVPVGTRACEASGIKHPEPPLAAFNAAKTVRSVPQPEMGEISGPSRFT